MVTFVTRGGTCIGRASDLALAREAAQVAVISPTSELIEETVRAIETNRGDALANAGDVTHAGDGKAAIRAAVERFGRNRAALNNAGIEQPHHADYRHRG